MMGNAMYDADIETLESEPGYQFTKFESLADIRNVISCDLSMNHQIDWMVTSVLKCQSPMILRQR